MRRIAGVAAPIPNPETMRPASSTASDVPKAIARSPATLTRTPIATTRRAWPRSASGPITSWLTKPATNPTPISQPIAASEMSYWFV